MLPALLATQAAAPFAFQTTPHTVAEFLAQADALLLSGHETAGSTAQADAIRSAIQQAAMAYRSSLAEAALRGEPAASCPPPPGQAQLSLADISDDLRAFPQAHRSMPLDTAFALVMTLRYPCQREVK
ncbi:hypothetical protein [Blastomonas sp. AAP53]|uniref:hypothetical protein n=1 Tax=Blastomonas sp. AAP53 TaxID=1248760 RepID=UPI0002F74063|nr:hypothetical protein [Blastomonas sp. AAP53]